MATAAAAACANAKCGGCARLLLLRGHAPHADDGARTDWLRGLLG